MNPRTSQDAYQPGLDSTEPIQPGPDGVVGEIFLAPRVIDRRAFGELASELRRLVERAAAERASLGGALDQTAESLKAIRQSEASQQGNLELTARALKRLDERLAKSQQLLDQASSVSSLIEKFDGRADALIEHKIQALEARLEAAEAGAAARVESLEQRLKSSTREIEQRIAALRQDAEGVVGPALAALSEALERAQGMLGRSPTDKSGTPATPGSLTDIVERAERAKAGGDEALSRLLQVQTTSAATQTTVNALAEQLAGLMIRLEDRRDQVAEEINRLEREAASVSTGLNARLGDFRREAESVLAEVKPSADAAAARASEAISELSGLITRTEDAHNATSLALRLADKSRAQLGAALSALEPWRAVLLDGRSGADLPAPIRAMLDAVRRELAEHLGQIADSLQGAARSAQRAAGMVSTGAENVAIPTQIVGVHAAGQIPKAAVLDSHGAD